MSLVLESRNAHVNAIRSSSYCLFLSSNLKYVKSQDVKNSQDITSESPGWLRVSVEGGGCSGFQYKLDLEEGELSLGDEDVVVEREGARVVVDQTSLEYLQVSRPHP